jgi:enterochelin esterase family protein
MIPTSQGLLWLLFILAANLPFLEAQFPSASPPEFVAPEVHADRTVTFHLRAPDARKVVVWGEWMPQGYGHNMTVDGQGVWSATLGPLRPDIYLYAFAVDGVRLPDPSNRQVKNGYPGLSSILEVPGPEAEFLMLRDVPHGALHVHYYHSRASQIMRRVYVYTPPGFGRSPRHAYPALYLLHGSWDTDADWPGVGRASIILDNLIAQRRAVPMLLVMPDGHPFPSFEPSTRGRNLALLERELDEDLLPLIERLYSASRQAKDRAIAGCSMGGTQALHIGLRHLNRFAAIGVMSAPGDVPFSDPFPKALAAVLDQRAEVNRRLRLFWIACGRDDNLLLRAREVKDALAAHGLRHSWRETEGAHNWMTWRRYLAELAPLLFR